MKTLLFTVIFAFSSIAFSAFNIKAGLWKYELEIEIAGQKFNPMPAIEQIMANLPPEKQKEIRDKLGQQGKGNISEVCLTKDMIDKGLLEGKKRDDCTFTSKTNTPNHVSGSFVCKDGTKGNVDWKADSTTAFSGTVDATTGDGKSTKIDYKARFLKEKCKG